VNLGYAHVQFPALNGNASKLIYRKLNYVNKTLTPPLNTIRTTYLHNYMKQKSSDCFVNVCVSSDFACVVRLNATLTYEQ